MKVSREKNAYRVILRHDLTFSHAEKLKEQLAEIITAMESGPLILDLSQVKEIDDRGLKLLLGLYKTCSSQGWQLTIETTSPAIMKFLAACKLSGLFEIKEVISHDTV
jgi:anti-anti-sigma factor